MARMAFPAHKPFLRTAPPAAGPATSGRSFGILANWIIAVFVLGTATFSLYLTQVSSVATAGYDLERLNAERAGWLARNEQLEFELAKRRSLAWTEAQAVQRLGMIRGAPPIYVTVVAPSTERPVLFTGPSTPEVPSPAGHDATTGPDVRWLERWLALAGPWLSPAPPPVP